MKLASRRQRTRLCAALQIQRKLPAEKEVLRCDGSPWCEQQHSEAGQVGKQLSDDSSQRDHATIMPQLGKGPATRSIRLGSNICGAQAPDEP
jgi:toxin HigB-1